VAETPELRSSQVPSSDFSISGSCFRTSRTWTFQFCGSIALSQRYVHPHIGVLADAIVSDFGAAGKWIGDHAPKGHGPKSLDAVLHAIDAYKKDLLPGDGPMQELLRELGPDHNARH
jgi:hypothetical protein